MVLCVVQLVFIVHNQSGSFMHSATFGDPENSLTNTDFVIPQYMCSYMLEQFWSSYHLSGL